jgi:hypothetical protein
VSTAAVAPAADTGVHAVEQTADTGVQAVDHAAPSVGAALPQVHVPDVSAVNPLHDNPLSSVTNTLHDTGVTNLVEQHLGAVTEHAPISLPNLDDHHLGL